MSDQLIKRPDQIELGAIMKIAVEKGDESSVAALKQLVDLAMNMEDRNAQKEYFVALAAFQDECPEIPKKKQVIVKRDNRELYRFKFAELAAIRKFIRPYLAQNDLSVSWGDAAIIDDGLMRVSCICRHIGGGIGESAFTTPITSNNPGMSDQQKTAGASTLCQRQSLILVLGLTTCDEDMAGAPPELATVLISPKQAADLEAMIDEVKADRPKFLSYLDVKSTSDLPQSRFQEAVAALEAKRDAQ